jgi:predicted TIM-barrel fold metal-dependent hydrolase
MGNKIVIDAHCHIMNNKCIPKKHRTRQSKIKPEIIEWILEKFDFDNTNYNWIDKFQSMIRIGNINSIEEVAKFLIEQSGNTKQDIKTMYVPLMMDMTHEPRKWILRKLGRETIMTFEKQVEQNKNVILNNPGIILPFLAADPRTIKRIGIEDFMQIYRKNGFIGMKVYPPLGYEPSHPVLIKLYKKCIEENIPVTTHCCYGGSYSTSKKDLNGKKLRTENERLEYWGNMPNPDKWFKMMEENDLHKLE